VYISQGLNNLKVKKVKIKIARLLDWSRSLSIKLSCTAWN